MKAYEKEFTRLEKFASKLVDKETMRVSGGCRPAMMIGNAYQADFKH